MLRRFFSYYKPYKKLFLLDFTCAVVAGLLELGFPIAVNQFVDKLLPGKDWSLIVWASAALLGIYVLNTVLNYIVTYWGHMLGVNIETNMRKKMFDHLQKLSFRFFDNHKTGHLMSRISNDLDNIGEVAHHGPEDLFIAGMTLVGSFLLMLAINWKLAVLTFLVVPVLVWAALYFNGKMTKTYRGLFSALADFNSRVEENIGGIRVVQA
ncbi:MAG: ABC transporter ATP-binding protein, partial [Paenibacillus macerans]|nr:ABC transporter ATP-binding protein [Paenibacillus macerans]